MANLNSLLSILVVLQDDAKLDFEKEFIDMGHDVLYLPYHEETGEVAKKLLELECFWDSEAGSWATF